MIAGLDHVQIAIPTGGETAARRYYGDLIGLSEIPKPAALARNGGCWFNLGAQQLHIGVDPDFRSATKAHIALSCTALDEMRQRIEKAGFAAHHAAPMAGRQRFFSVDPFGNRIEFIEEEAEQ
jgi:catechol 2,3-dioxygenase-like lactoylglutathione lyase family enzyme